MHRLIAFAAVLSLLAAIPAYAATPAQKAAVAALVAAYHARGWSDIEQPSCFVVQTWAQCDFGTAHGRGEGTAWLHRKNGKWAFLGQGGGVTYASMMERRYGIPAAIAKQFQAKLCPNPCPGS